MSAKAQITKAFITRGMEVEAGMKFQSISFKQGNSTSYVSIYLDEATRVANQHLLIKGQQVLVEGNLSVITSKYKGVMQKNPTIWVERIVFSFTPEQIAERAAKLAAGEKPESQGKETMTTKVETPSGTVQVEEGQIAVGTPTTPTAAVVEASQAEPQQVQVAPQSVEEKINIDDYVEYETNVDEEVSEEDVLAIMGKA